MKQRPVFSSVVLGHLFMRKYGLGREQRSHLVRATGGSCRFEDAERILRASDFEDRPDHGGKHGHLRGRKDAVLMAEAGDSGSMSEPSPGASSAEANELDFSTDDAEVMEELEEAYEVQKKEKAKTKRHFRNYRDSRRKIQEIKKNRQPYMPVVALAPGAPASTGAAAPIQPTFKYDRKKSQGADKDRGSKKSGWREEVSMVSGSTITEFAYTVDAGKADDQELEFEVLTATVPEGMAVIDTGCTTSVVGSSTADRYQKYFESLGMPAPEKVELPPVQLKGFNGVRSATREGLRWLVKIGQL